MESERSNLDRVPSNRVELIGGQPTADLEDGHLEAPRL